VAAAVALRLGSAIYQGATIQALPGVADQISYHSLALRVVEGHGFSFATPWWPATRAGEPTAHWSFLYVLFLSAVYLVAGPVPLIARLVQAVIVGVVHPWLAWRIGRRLFNSTVGLVSAALTAFYGYFVFYAGSLVTESLYFVATLWALDAATAIGCRVRDGAPISRRHWMWLGLAMAVTVLLRQAFLLMVPVILTWIFWQLRRHRRAASPAASLRTALGGPAMSLVVLGVCVLPWTIRNYQAFGDFVLLNTNAGFVLFWGNHPVHGTSFIPILPGGALNYGALLPKDLTALNEAQLDRTLLRRGAGFIAADPGRYVRLSISRAREYFKFWPSAESSRASNLVRVLSFGVVFPFMVLGAALMVVRRWQQAAHPEGVRLLLLVAVLYSVVHLLTWTLVRYRLPVDAITMPIAASAVVAVYRGLAAAVRLGDPALADPPRRSLTPSGFNP
jgi:Dolichyl-phosphate-mannose-protein mannosyltransferase